MLDFFKNYRKNSKAKILFDNTKGSVEIGIYGNTISLQAALATIVRELIRQGIEAEDLKQTFEMAIQPKELTHKKATEIREELLFNELLNNLPKDLRTMDEE